MKTPTLSYETVHTSCVAIGGRAVLIGGRSGKGKSDLALRLIDRGAALVSDDYTFVRRVEGRLLASAPDTITGRSRRAASASSNSRRNATCRSPCSWTSTWIRAAFPRPGRIARLPESPFRSLR